MIERLRERLRGSALGTRLARGAAWSVVGGVLSRALMLMVSIAVARILRKEAFGELGIVQSTVGMVGVVAASGLGITSTKFVAEFRGKDPARAARILALSNAITLITSILLAATLFVLAPWLARHTLAAPHLGPALRVAAALILLMGISSAQNGALAGLEAFKALAKLNLLAGVVSVPLVIGGALWHGVIGSLCGFTLASAVACVFGQFVLRREAKSAGIPLGIGLPRSEMDVMWKFALPSVLAVLMVGPVHWACSTFLVNQPGGYAAMGAFNAANQWFTVLLFLPALLGQSVLPLMAERLGADAVGQSRRLLEVSMKLNSLIVIPVVLFAIASPLLMSWFGESFRGEWPTLVVVLATAAVLAVQTPVGQILVASGKLWTGFAMNVGWAIVYAAATWMLVERGALGLAIARLIAYAVHGVWTLWYAYRILRVERRVGDSA